MEENTFKQDAKSIVDTFFDNRLFHDSITRDNMIAVEDLISYMLQSRFDGYIKMNKIINSIKEKK